jgi:hypothetical protein
MKIGWIVLGKIESVLIGHLLTDGYSMSIHGLRSKCGRDLVAAYAAWLDSTMPIPQAGLPGFRT